METNVAAQFVSRRNILRTGAALGLAVPAGLGALHPAAAQEDAVDYSGHPAVGVWIEGGSGPTFAYQVVHADGTLLYYNPWLASTGQGDPKVPVIGFGVWRPVSERVYEGIIRIAWLDTTVTTLLTLKGRSEIIESGRYVSSRYKARLVDASGNVLITDSGTATAERMVVEPFDEPEVPDATPANP